MDDGYQQIQEMQTALKEDNEMMNEASLSLQNQIQNIKVIASKCSFEMRQKPKYYALAENFIEMIGILLQYISAEGKGLESSHGECYEDDTILFAIGHTNYARWPPLFI